MGKLLNTEMDKTLRIFLFSFAVLVVFAACNLPEGIPGISYPGTPTVTPLIFTSTPAGDSPLASGEAPQVTPEPSIVVSPTEAPLNLWIAPYLPKGITQGLVAPFPITINEDSPSSDLVIDIGNSNVFTRLVYALVVPFPSLEEAASVEDLMQAWGGNPSGKFLATHLYLSEATYVIFTRWWGPPVGDFVRILPEDQILQGAWQEGSAWAIVPFEKLEPHWKVISVDGGSPIWKSFDPQKYALSVPVSLTGNDPSLVDALTEALAFNVPSPYNRDENKLTTVVLTGVTALVRATAAEMEVKGITYPAAEVGDMFREADILHISNEVPFAATCPQPDYNDPDLVFCSSPDYMQLLEEIGTDVVELTGDHFGDWGTAAVLETLNIYDAAGIAYYGGGETVEEAQAPSIFEHNGNRIAFVGCNAKGGSYTPLIRDLPGAVDCRFNNVTSTINQLDQDGYVVIMTFQHFEYYYFDPNYVLENDFRLVADAGADIVSGSQAHQPHGMEFYNNSTLFYGLGNLFFDQLLVSEDTIRALITRNVIYDNQYISSEIFTLFFSDFSTPRYMNAGQRSQLLWDVFSASEWGGLTFGQ